MKLYGVRILFVLGLWSAFYGNFAEAASVGEIASYRGADRQARLEKGAKAEGELPILPTVRDAGRAMQVREGKEEMIPHGLWNIAIKRSHPRSQCWSLSPLQYQHRFCKA